MSCSPLTQGVLPLGLGGIGGVLSPAAGAAVYGTQNDLITADPLTGL